jgi:hypothetical protein
MKPRICIGCGAAIPERANALSRNPNLCASCSSLTDEMDESDTSELTGLEPVQFPAGEKLWETRKAA